MAIFRTGHNYLMAAPDFDQLKNWISLLTSCSIDFMRATKESLECEHDERDRQMKNEQKEIMDKKVVDKIDGKEGGSEQN